VIVIDDYIPCNNNKKPIFTKFNGHEMWPLLLEKAYAKFKGNYHNIEKGNPLVALKELTGFEGEQFIGGFNEEFFKKLQRYSNYGALMTASSKGKDNTKQQHDNGVVLKSSIVPGHAYSILDIKTPMLTTSRIYLLKLRNPWYSSYGTLYLL
jgi:calpain-15